MLKEGKVLDKLKKKIVLAISNGVPEEEIKETLLKVGWKKEQFEPIFEQIKNKTLPTEKQIGKDMKKAFGRNYIEQESASLLGFVITILSIIFIIFFVIFFENFFQSPATERSFVFESCSAGRLSTCELTIYSNISILSYDIGKNLLDSAEIDICRDMKLHENNTVELYNCEFSTLRNNFDILLRYENPTSKLIHDEKINVRKTIEITSLKYYLSEIFGRFQKK